MAAIAKRIHYLRRSRARLTQQALADQLGVTKAAISAWETGKDSPAGYRIPAIAKALCCTIGELYGERRR